MSQRGIVGEKLLGSREVVVEEIVVGETLRVDLTDLSVDDIAQLVEIGLDSRGDEYAIALAGHPCLLEIVERDILTGRRCEIVFILRCICESVDLVENDDLRLVGTIEITERLVDGGDLRLESRV